MIKMYKQVIKSKRGSCLRKNFNKELILGIKATQFGQILIINQDHLYTNITKENLIVKPLNYYMVINNSKSPLEISYNDDISKHELIYDPYLFENSEKKNLSPDEILNNFSVPEGYLDVLAKWYSIKFNYLNYNLIFIRPELGISIQIHENRSEKWEILSGHPIIINVDKVYYFVEKGSEFSTPNKSFHSVINPSKKQDDYVIIKETWTGNFNEKDIKRIFNPNHYY
jgi:mannose-6-phosphate isomerase-like protein (cupin superfamily)